MLPDPDVIPDLVDALLSLPTLERQEASLLDAGLLNAEGLDGLLDAADWLLNNDPGKAQLLAELCLDLAERARAPATVPRANYICAGAHNLKGNFEADLRLTKAAYDEYVALGMNLEALRTNVGKMAALLELGRYQEALDAGQAVLDALDGKGELEVTPTRQQADLLSALVHQNIGGCYEHMGRYGKALEAWASARELYRALGMTEKTGEIKDSEGVVLRYLGRGRRALAAHKTAAAIFSESGLPLAYAIALGNIGETHLQLGDYTHSLEAFERARRLLDSLDAPVDKHVLLLDTANAYLALNLYPEALATYREAGELLRDSGMMYEHARGLWGAGSALIAQSEFEEAERALDEAASLFATVENVPFLSGVMLEQASLLATRGDLTTALPAARRALDLVAEDDWPVQRVYAHLRLADLLLPDVAEAEQHLLEAQRLTDQLPLPHLRYRVNERLGHLRRLQCRGEEARMLLEAAVDEIEHLRGIVSQDAMRASFVRDKTAAYENLLQLYLSEQDAENVRRAFTAAERAKSRALVDLLTGVVGNESETLADSDSELEDHLQALQADLNVVYNELLGSTDNTERRVSFMALQARAVEVEQEISRLRLQAAATGSSPNPFAAPMKFDDLQNQLPSDVTLLAYHVVDDEILVFVNTGGRVQVARRLGTAANVQRLLQQLAVQWDRFRVGGDFAGRHVALLERSARQALSALYAALMAPLEPLLEEVEVQISDGVDPVRKLAIVPHGPLHQVPFHALFDDEQYLIERFEISYAPSATVYALCQRRAQRDSGGALVFGVEDPLIPSATVEAGAVARHLPGATVRIGEEATIAALQNEAPGRGILHLVSHGLFRSDNPIFSALKLHDGWLMAADAMNLDLSGAIVTLSACESGRSEVIGGDEVLGLSRAFLGAGAATLVVSLWLVQDETTAALMEKWYERLRHGMGRAEALRAAQLEVKDQHPHPYYWAPFVLIGKR